MHHRHRISRSQTLDQRPVIADHSDQKNVTNRVSGGGHSPDHRQKQTIDIRLWIKQQLANSVPSLSLRPSATKPSVSATAQGACNSIGRGHHDEKVSKR
jgi:hypothetical protein